MKINRLTYKIMETENTEDKPERSSDSPGDSHMVAKDLVVGKRRRRSSSKKSEDGSNKEAEVKEKDEDSQRSSPEPTCAICLESLQNKSFTDRCAHAFCFTCLLEWSKVKAECPLCKKPFKVIIHKVHGEYEEYFVEQRPNDICANHPFEVSLYLNSPSQRFRYRTTLTPGSIPSWHIAASREANASRTSLESQIASHRMRYAPHSMRIRSRIASNAVRPEITAFDREGADFRARVYRAGLWVKSNHDSRSRKASPSFFQENPALIHRLVPWLTRELHALLDNSSQVSFLLDLVIELIIIYDITSLEFFVHMEPHLRANTAHFIHEFYNFATSPSFSYQAYDNSASYNFTNVLRRERERMQRVVNLSSSPAVDNEVSSTTHDISRLRVPPIRLNELRFPPIWSESFPDDPSVPTTSRNIPLVVPPPVQRTSCIVQPTTFNHLSSPIPSTSRDVQNNIEYLVSDTDSSLRSEVSTPNSVSSASEGEIQVIDAPPKAPPEIIEIDSDDDDDIDIEETSSKGPITCVENDDVSLSDIEFLYESSTLPSTPESCDIEVAKINFSASNNSHYSSPLNSADTSQSSSTRENHAVNHILPSLVVSSASSHINTSANSVHISGSSLQGNSLYTSWQWQTNIAPSTNMHTATSSTYSSIADVHINFPIISHMPSSLPYSPLPSFFDRAASNRQYPAPEQNLPTPVRLCAIDEKSEAVKRKKAAKEDLRKIKLRSVVGHCSFQSSKNSDSQKEKSDSDTHSSRKKHKKKKKHKHKHREEGNG